MPIAVRVMEGQAKVGRGKYINDRTGKVGVYVNMRSGFIGASIWVD